MRTVVLYKYCVTPTLSPSSRILYFSHAQIIAIAAKCTVLSIYFTIEYLIILNNKMFL